MSTEPYSPGAFHQGAWLVYMNGIEIPCPSVVVDYGVGTIPSATLSFAPHRLLQRLGSEDRIEVVIFYLDTTLDPDKPAYRLLFEGEILGWSYRNSPSGRSMSFDAVADITVFKELYFFFMNTVEAAVGAATTPGFNANNVSQPGAFYPFSLFKKGLLSGSKKPPADIDRPYELVYNVLRGLLSSDLPPEHRTLPAANFFARLVRKRNFINRFIALPVFEDEADDSAGVFPIFKAVQADFALSTIQENLAATVGGTGSVYDVLEHVLGVVYCELAMLPTAPCYRVRLSDGTVIGTSDTPPSQPDKAHKEPLRLANYFVKPQMLFSIPPSCNVFFPSMIKSVEFSENYRAQPTRSYVNDTLITGKVLPQNAFTSAALTFGYPSEVGAVLKGTGNDMHVASTGKDVLVFPEEYFKGPVVHRAPVPSWFTLLQNKNKANKDASDPAVKTEHAKLVKLYELYVQYEHYRNRYSKRGGAADLAWNPYPVPGFPCVVFDQRASAVDVVGYLLSVRHTLNAQGGMSTAVNYSYGRTLQEMLDLMREDMTRLGVAMGSAPAEPLDQVRAIGQDFDKAEQFYNAVFHGRQPLGNRKASFDLREVVGFVGDDEDGVEPINIEGPTAEQKATRFAFGFEGVDGRFNQVSEAQVDAVRNNVKHNIDAEKDLSPLSSFEAVFHNYDLAMQYVARPICTLDEYISFIHGGKTIPELTAEGQVAGPEDDYGYNELQEGPARYYARIRKLRQGPGPRPPPEAVGAAVSPPPAGGTTNAAVPYTGPRAGVSPDFPQTRADWDSALLAYRDEILNAPHPQR